jgi:hypothetical protein
MSNKTPLKPDDFPVHVEGDTVKKHDGKPLGEDGRPGRGRRCRGTSQ